MTAWIFRGVGAAQGFADDPVTPLVIFVFFCFIGILIGSPLCGFVFYNAVGPEAVPPGRKLDHFDDLA